MDRKNSHFSDFEPERPKVQFTDFGEGKHETRLIYLAQAACANSRSCDYFFFRFIYLGMT